MPPFYVTTPIYYVNDIPHIGHAYTTTIADEQVAALEEQTDEELLEDELLVEEISIDGMCGVY